MPLSFHPSTEDGLREGDPPAMLGFSQTSMQSIERLPIDGLVLVKLSINGDERVFHGAIQAE